MLLKDAGARGEYIHMGATPAEYPEARLANHREHLRKEALFSENELFAFRKI